MNGNISDGSVKFDIYSNNYNTIFHPVENKKWKASRQEESYVIANTQPFNIASFANMYFPVAIYGAYNASVTPVSELLHTIEPCTSVVSYGGYFLQDQFSNEYGYPNGESTLTIKNGFDDASLDIHFMHDVVAGTVTITPVRETARRFWCNYDGTYFYVGYERYM